MAFSPVETCCTFCGDKVTGQAKGLYLGVANAKPKSRQRNFSRNLVEILCQAANIPKISTNNSQNNYCTTCDKHLTEIATSYAQLQRQLLQIKAIILQRRKNKSKVNGVGTEIDREEGQIQRILVQELNPFLILERISSTQGASVTGGGVAQKISFEIESESVPQIKSEPLEQLEFETDFEILPEHEAFAALDHFDEPEDTLGDSEYLPPPPKARRLPGVKRHPRNRTTTATQRPRPFKRRRYRFKTPKEVIPYDESDMKLTPLLDGSYVFCGVKMSLVHDPTESSDPSKTRRNTLASFRCGSCATTVKGLYIMKAHVRRVHLRLDPHEKHHVKIAGKRVKLDPNSTPDALILHGVPCIKLGDGRYKCGSCFVTYSRRNELFLHIRHTHANLPKEPRPTRYGPKTETASNRLNSKKTEDGRTFFCGVEITSLPNSRWGCGLCDERINYRYKCSVYTHIQKHHPGNRPYICPEPTCGLSFPYKPLLEAHSIRHAVDKPWICEKCGVSLKRKDSLREHDKRVHQGIINATCDTCGKGFYTRKDLKMHVKVHHK